MSPLESYGATRVLALAFGLTLLASMLLLADLLGSLADSNATYSARIHDGATRARDTAGGALLIVAAMLLACTGQALRRDLSRAGAGLAADIVAALSFVAAPGLLAATGLLLTAPVSAWVGDLFDDPSIDAGAAAALSQAGTVALWCAMPVLGAWTILAAHMARRSGATGRPSLITAWIAGLLTLIAVTVAATFPIAIWWAVFGLTARLPADREAT
jgi:hypothetical protein